MAKVRVEMDALTAEIAGYALTEAAEWWPQENAKAKLFSLADQVLRKAGVRGADEDLYGAPIAG